MAQHGPLVGLLAAVVVTVVAYAWYAVPCGCDTLCAQAVPAAYHQRAHAFVALGLGVVLLRESSLLMVSIVDRVICKTDWSLLDQGLAQMLLCLLLTSLTSMEVYLAWTPLPWVHVAHGMPVFTIRYASWLVDVPLLLLLTCCAGLNRPLSEALGPILATNGYILVSWAALFVENSHLRYLLIAGTFVAYGWASDRMMGWVRTFLKEAPEEAPCRRARISAVLLLIGVFGLYGVVYLLAAAGAMDFSTEMLCYTLMGMGCKMTLSILFASIRSYQNHQALARLVFKVRGSSVAFVSLLRGTFDHVVPCTVQSNGVCELPARRSRDLRELEHLLGRPLAAASFNDQLAGGRERERFNAYVQNALRQHADLLKAGEKLGLVPDSSLPPVAQALHVRLRRTSELPEEGLALETLRVMVHLSMAPQEAATEWPQQAVLALQVLSQEENALGLSALKGIAQEVEREASVGDLREDCGSIVDEISVEGQVGNGVRMSSSGTMYSTKKSTAVTTSSGNDEALENACRKSSGKNISHRRRLRTAKLLVRVLNRRSRPKRPSCRRASGKVRNRFNCNMDDVETTSNRSSCQQVSFECGGSDVCSQSSRLSPVNSVVVACRQLLGPLHDRLPPAQYISKRVEDHLTCSAEMVKLKAFSEISRHCYNQRLADWTDRADSYRTSVLLNKGRSPDEQLVPEQIWRSEVLGHLQAPHPGPRPVEPLLPKEEDLWHKAWKRTYESDSESEDTEGVAASMQL